MKILTKSRFLLSILVLLTASLTACSVATPQATMNPIEAPALATETLVPATSTQPPPQFPTGKFISVENPNNVYRFEEDNTWSYYIGGLMGAKGTFRVEGDQWIEEGTSECPFSGTYQWTFEGETLTFSLIGNDNCTPRKEATDGQKFSLAP